MGIRRKANMATMVMVIIRVIDNLIVVMTTMTGTGVVITAAKAAMVNIVTMIDLLLGL
jgi:hypothetical protein